MTIVGDPKKASRPRWLTATLVAVCFLPALISITPLILEPLWYLTDDQNAQFLSMGRVCWLVLQVLVGVAPFLCAGTALISSRMSGVPWSAAAQFAGWWAFWLGVVAFGIGGMAGGGV